MTTRSLTDRLLNLLFPDPCAGGRRCGQLLCAQCRATLAPYPGLTRPLIDQTSGERFPLHAVMVQFRFEGAIREAIHSLKYKRVRRMAAPLAELMADYWRQCPLAADALLPVPLHPARLAERGFNQSDLLAQQLAAHIGLPVQRSGLERVRNTAQQVGLEAKARYENVRQAFAWQAGSAPPPRVVLIDDVLTTGATLGACAQVLRQAGTREVRAFVLARSATD